MPSLSRLLDLRIFFSIVALLPVAAGFSQSESERPTKSSAPRLSTPTRPWDVPAAPGQEEPKLAVPPPPTAPKETEPVQTVREGVPLSSATAWLDAQIVLSRVGFSCGPIDGVGGPQTRAALQAFQASENLPVTGVLDVDTRARLVLTAPPLTQSAIAEADLARLQPLSPTWLGKSEQSRLEYTSILELVAERSRASPALIRRLNPTVDWSQPPVGTVVTVPAIVRLPPATHAAHLHIRLAERILTARDEQGRVLVRFPVSIAREVAKRPVGELRVTVAIPNPDYTFDPEVFPESKEGRELGRKLILPPGPNNPVGVAWIGLDRPGYGIHGTPSPEQVGRTESHGCFRLANWDAETLLALVWVGLPVFIEP